MGRRGGNTKRQIRLMPRKKIKCGECTNAQCFVKRCNFDFITSIDDKKNQLVLKKGQPVFQEGDHVFGIYFIQKGKVKVVSSTSQEDVQQIVRLATDGHLLGHRGYGNETYPIGAIAMDETKVCFIDNNNLLEIFKANFDFVYAIMMFYSTELRKSEDRTKNFGRMTVNEKVIFSLLYLIDTFGLDSNNLFNAVVSRQEIADIAGTNADQVSRTISQLRDLGHISTKGSAILVNDLDGLKSGVRKYL